MKSERVSGRIIAIDGRCVYVESSGVGTPVVFEAGAGEWSAHWALVVRAIRDRYRCIAYDRADLGRREPAVGPRTAGVAAHNAAWREASARLSDRSPDSNLQFLDGTDHMVQLQKPEAVIDAILELDCRILEARRNRQQ